MVVNKRRGLRQGAGASSGRYGSAGKSPHPLSDMVAEPGQLEYDLVSGSCHVFSGSSAGSVSLCVAFV